MVKQKLGQPRRASSKKHQNKGSVDPPEEGDWTMVKKQKITILIPPLPNKGISSMPSLGEGQLQETPRSSNSQSPKSIHEQQTSKSLATKQNIHPPLIVDPSEPNLTPQKPSGLRHRIASDNSRLCKRTIIFSDSKVFLDRRMRASYLDKTLKKAGGLENWLVSIGLGHFVKVFEMRNVNKFQLANLTMKKLKDMGTDAVGPRRKLIHAIDCLCDPHCFQHV